MTVRELIQFLEQFPEDAPVVIDDYNCGYGGLFPVDSVEEETVSWDGEVGHYYRDDEGIPAVRIGK